MKKLNLPLLKKDRRKEEPREHILNDQSSFNIVETYKTIRTNIMFSVPKTDNGKVIVITSAAPGEGKTTTTINLAISFAQMGAKVMVMDCDLRKSRIHRYLGVERKDGVSNVLCGFTDLDKAIKKNVRDNLDCLTAGEIPPNPAELLGSEAFEELISTLCQRYDYVFIDTPPVTVVTDALLAMENCTGVVVVVRKDVTTYDELDITMDSIKKGEVKIFGVVMVGSEAKVKKYGHYRKYGSYGYKYSYRYKYHYGDTPVDDEKE